MKIFTDYEKGFLEGLIDGEGSLMIHKPRPLESTIILEKLWVEVKRANHRWRETG